MKKMSVLIALFTFLAGCEDGGWTHLDNQHVNGDVAELHSFRVPVPDANDIENIDPFQDKYRNKVWYIEDGFPTTVEYYAFGALWYIEESDYYEDFTLKYQVTIIPDEISDTVWYSRQEDFVSTLQQRIDGELKNTFELVFDEKGRMLESKGLEDYNGGPYHVIHQYDENDNLVFSSQMVGEESFTMNFSYKEHDLQELICEYADGRETYTETHESYKYDEKGNWIEKWIYRDGELLEVQYQKFVYRD